VIIAFGRYIPDFCPPPYRAVVPGLHHRLVNRLRFDFLVRNVSVNRFFVFLKVTVSKILVLGIVTYDITLILGYFNILISNDFFFGRMFFLSLPDYLKIFAVRLCLTFPVSFLILKILFNFDISCP